MDALKISWDRKPALMVVALIGRLDRNTSSEFGNFV